MAVGVEHHLKLHPSVSLRPERFGALAYSFDNRRLSFLKHPDLVEVVESLDGDRTVGEVLAAVGIHSARCEPFLQALETLHRSGMIVEVGAGRAG